MLTRIITAIVALLLLIPVLAFGGAWGAGALFALICGFSTYEMLSCCGLIKKWAFSLPVIVIAAFTAIVPVILFPHTMFVIGYCLAAIVAVMLCFMFVAVVGHKKIDCGRLLMFFILALYITAGFASLSYLRAFYGLWVLAFVLCVAWVTDTMAYFSGMLLGKRKLCPEISPKKTVAGAIGGTLFGTLAGVAVFWIAFGYPLQGLIALPLSIVSQLGDLSASVIKRHFGVKDYGKIFPGHGGVLDRFDSIIPVAIVMAALVIGINAYALLF